MEKYFLPRNKAGQEPSLISESEPSEKSFGVKFAQESEPMMELRTQILELIETEIVSVGPFRIENSPRNCNFTRYGVLF